MERTKFYFTAIGPAGDGRLRECLILSSLLTFGLTHESSVRPTVKDSQEGQNLLKAHETSGPINQAEIEI